MSVSTPGITNTPNTQAIDSPVLSNSKAVTTESPATSVSDTSKSSLTLHNTISKNKRVTAAQLQKQFKTYCFSEQDAKNITAFAEKYIQAAKGQIVFSEYFHSESFHEREIKLNLDRTLRTKIESLIAKICQFFGNPDRANKLKQEGFKLLKDFREEVIKLPGKLKDIFVIYKDLEDHGYDKNGGIDLMLMAERFGSSFPEATGLSWVLSPKLMAMAGGSLRGIDDLVLHDNNREAQKLFLNDIVFLKEGRVVEEPFNFDEIIKNLMASEGGIKNFLNKHSEAIICCPTLPLRLKHLSAKLPEPGHPVHNNKPLHNFSQQIPATSKARPAPKRIRPQNP